MPISGCPAQPSGDQHQRVGQIVEHDLGDRPLAPHVGAEIALEDAAEEGRQLHGDRDR